MKIALIKRLFEKSVKNRTPEYRTKENFYSSHRSRLFFEKKNYFITPLAAIVASSALLLTSDEKNSSTEKAEAPLSVDDLNCIGNSFALFLSGEIKKSIGLLVILSKKHSSLKKAFELILDEQFNEAIEILDGFFVGQYQADYRLIKKMISDALSGDSAEISHKIQKEIQNYFPQYFTNERSTKLKITASPENRTEINIWNRKEDYHLSFEPDGKIIRNHAIQSGHVSMQTNQHYISAWPARSESEKIHYQLSFLDDVAEYERLPDYHIVLYTLNNHAMNTAFESIKSNPNITWHRFGSFIIADDNLTNCSGLIYQLLNCGGIKFIGFYHPQLTKGLFLSSLYYFIEKISMLTFHTLLSFRLAEPLTKIASLTSLLLLDYFQQIAWIKNKICSNISIDLKLLDEEFMRDFQNTLESFFQVNFVEKHRMYTPVLLLTGAAFPIFYAVFFLLNIANPFNHAVYSALAVRAAISLCYTTPPDLSKITLLAQLKENFKFDVIPQNDTKNSPLFWAKSLAQAEKFQDQKIKNSFTSLRLVP